MRTLTIAVACLLLAACHKDSKPTPQAEDPGAPQVTSIDDTDLPTDKSDQITSIDAATGDASGMPKDGGAVVQVPKPTVAAAAPAPAAAPAAADSPPTVTLPDVPPPPAAGTMTPPSGQ